METPKVEVKEPRILKDAHGNAKLPIGSPREGKYVLLKPEPQPIMIISVPLKDSLEDPHPHSPKAD